MNKEDCRVMRVHKDLVSKIKELAKRDRRTVTAETEIILELGIDKICSNNRYSNCKLEVNRSKTLRRKENLK